MKKKTQDVGGRYAMTAKELCYIAVAVALLAVCSWLCIPVGNVPITLQTLALFVIVGTLGVKRASLAVFAWLALGLFGVPVFAGFTGGVGKLFTPTGGFLIGFLVATPMMGVLYKGRLWQKAFALFLGVLIYNAFAIVWFCVLYTGFLGSGLLVALTACTLPYLPFDCIKLAVAMLLTERLKKGYKET